MKIKQVITGIILIAATAVSFALLTPQALIINNTKHTIDVTTVDSSGATNVIHLGLNAPAQTVTLPNKPTQTNIVYTQVTSASVDGVGAFGLYKSQCEAQTNLGDNSGYTGKINLFFNPANPKQLCCETNTEMYCSDSANP